MNKISGKDMRDALISRIYKMAMKDKDIFFISGEFGAPSLDAFRRDLPGQFINAGISEQNLISVSAGLALSGKKVYAYSIASFLTLRCFEQLKIDLSCMKLPVTLIGVGTCYSYPVDGPTHHASEDIALIRSLGNFHIYSPADSNFAAKLADISFNRNYPVYIRLEKGRYPFLHGLNPDFKTGFKHVLKGGDICFIATGSMVHRAMEVTRVLKAHNIKAGVLDMYRLKPVNKRKLVSLMKSYSRVVTLEEHTINGGLGSIIAELIVDEGLCIPTKRIAIDESLVYGYGLRDALHRRRKLDVESVVKTVLKWK